MHLAISSKHSHHLEQETLSQIRAQNQIKQYHFKRITMNISRKETNVMLSECIEGMVLFYCSAYEKQ